MSAAYFMDAARVPSTIAPQRFGLWEIQRLNDLPPAVAKMVGYPSQTILRRITLGTLHLDAGEIVMEDSRPELRKHLPIWISAKGRILVTGLGLGCVVRGLLASREVTHIDVVEIDPGIVAAVGPDVAADPRVNIHLADALEFPIKGRRWDFAWHDLWTDRSAGEPHLQCVHAKLIARLHGTARRQGAWAFPRTVSRRLKVQLLGAPTVRRTIIPDDRRAG
jgi:hypothetical protein